MNHSIFAHKLIRDQHTVSYPLYTHWTILVQFVQYFQVGTETKVGAVHILRKTGTRISKISSM